jgi:hypothetical protein
MSDLGKTVTDKRVGYGDLLASVSKFGDKDEPVLRAELFLLRKIAETSSDLVKAREWDEFREVGGGMKRFEDDHRNAVGTYEQWLADGEG